MKQPYDIYTTAQATDQRLSRHTGIPVATVSGPDFPEITVERRVQYQTIEGFGGAFTESAATTLLKLPKPLQDEVIGAYFDPVSGHGYSLCRTTINSCDFSVSNYSYAEVAGDVDLAHFSIAHDHEAIIPMIRRARAVAGDGMRLFASPWSPPAWMKSNASMNNGGMLKDEYRTTWASYYVRYIREYEKIGIPIWGLTIQNEPAAIQTWDSCLYTAEEERDFLRDYLGPALANAGLDDVKVMIWDHNRDLLFTRAKTVLDDPAAAKFVWGIAFHWYVADCFENVALTHDAFPDKALLLTEACVEMGPHDGVWSTGERYARSIVQDLNNWSAGWVDWNLLLDETGGPNHVGNFCSAPIIADTRTGELHYQSSFYYLGHFSRFIKPGAMRVLCASNRDALEATSAINPDGSLATIVLNRTDSSFTFRVIDRDTSVETTVPAHGIVTVCSPPRPT